MKIGIFDPYLDSLSGGEKYMLTAASCLSKKHSVYLFWDDKKVIKKAKNKFDIDLSRVKVVNNIFTPKISSGKRFLQSKKYDGILFLSDGSIPLVGCGLYLHFQFPVEWVNAKPIISRVKIKRAKRIICNSKFTKEYIDNKFGVNSLVIYPPIDDFKVQLSKKENAILNVGRYGKLSNGTSFKKQEFLIDAFKKMVDKGISDWKLYLVISFARKDFQDVQKLKKLAKGYPIEFFENLNLEELKDIYTRSRIYWHAAGFGENLALSPELAEHFGITTVEAMKNGLVPIVINAGGQREIVSDKIDGFLWKNESEIITLTQELMQDTELFKKLSQQAIKNSAKFSKKEFCAQINEVFIK